MSFLTLSIQCESDNHASCPGGEHQPGIIGGWDCSCECHRAAVVQQITAAEWRPEDYECVMTCYADDCSYPDCWVLRREFLTPPAAS
jgi:hypothetical protein